MKRRCRDCLFNAEKWSAGIAFALCFALCGCSGPRNAAKAPASFDSSGAPIKELNLLAVPVALNFDHLPGLDGFVLKIYAGNRNRPKPVPIESGKIEIMMYDGILKQNKQEPMLPRRVWSFTAEQLRRFEVRTSIGTGYELKPEWGDAKPASDRITVVARYISPEGSLAYSAPSVISVTGK